MDIERLRVIISNALAVPISKISEETRFIEDLGMDSLDFYQLEAALSKEFYLENKNVLPSIRSVGDLIHNLRNVSKL